MTSEDKIVSTEWNNTNEMTRTGILGIHFPAKSYAILRDFNDKTSSASKSSHRLVYADRADNVKVNQP